MIQENEKLKERAANMIERVYGDEPDKSIFPHPWKRDMVNWLNGYEVGQNSDGEDAGFFGWMEYKQGIFIVGGVTYKHREDALATRTALAIGKKWIDFFRKNTPSKGIYCYLTEGNKRAAGYAKILGIKIIYEMPEGLVR
jgi:hypothetical protein